MAGRGPIEANARAPATNMDSTIASIARKLKLGPADSLLDVGCGSGYIAAELARKVKTLTAVDYTPEMVGKANAYFAELGIVNARAEHGEIIALAFGPIFNKVLCYSVFHYIGEELESSLDSLIGCVNLGGLLLVGSIEEDVWSRDRLKAWSKSRGLIGEIMEIRKTVCDGRGRFDFRARSP